MQIKGILKAGGDLIENIGTAFDSNFTNKEEKLTAKTNLLNATNSLLSELQQLQADVIKSETMGNKLQRSWRPIVMLIFAFIVVYVYFIQPAIFPNAIAVALPVDFWALLKIGMGGYVIGRSGEKIATNVAEVIRKK